MHREEGGLLRLGRAAVGGGRCAGLALGEDLFHLLRRAAVGVLLARALERREAVAVLDGRVGSWVGVGLGVGLKLGLG
jgi:hypothetical protein